jgi:WD40 repeat protein
VSRGLDFVPRICDFGLAKLLDEVSQETSSGLAIGSPPYMAPEQAAGRNREQGPATDVYALGVILYELLTGRPPLRGETDLETLRLVSEQDPPPPRALRAGLPRDLETICLKCLEKRPDRRYAGASGLAEDLGRFLDGRPIRARRASPWERLGKWTRRRPVHAALAGVLGIVLLAGAGGLEWARSRDQRMRTAILEAGALRLRHEVTNDLKEAGWRLERGDRESARSILDSLARSPYARNTLGFPWSYLDRVSIPRVTALPPLPETAMSAAYSPDGRTLALGDRARNLFLMDRVSGRSRPLRGHPRHRGNPVLVFSPDGRHLASLIGGITPQDWDRMVVNLWDVASGEEIRGLPGSFDVCYVALFSPDGQRFITVESTATNRESPVRSWTFSDDRTRIVLGESLRPDQLPDRLAPSRRSANPGSRPFQLTDMLAVTPDPNSFTAVWPNDQEICLVETRSAAFPAVCRVDGNEVIVVPRRDRPTQYSQTDLETLGRLACTLTGCARFRLIRQEVPVLWAHFSFDGRTVAVIVPYTDRPFGRIRLIDTATGGLLAESPWGDVWLGGSFTLAPERDALLAVGFDARAREWDFHDERRSGILDAHKKEVWGLAFSPDGRTLASSSDDWTLKLWDIDSGLERSKIEGHGSLVTAVAYSPDGALVASASFDKKIRLWDASSGDPIDVLSGHPGKLRTVAFSPDGKWLASAGDDHQVRLWDVTSRRPHRTPLTDHTEGIFSLAFSPDGKTLFTGAQDKTIRLWDVASGHSRSVVWQAETPVYCVAPSPDGRALATAHPDGRVMLWDIAEGRARATMRGHTGEVYGLAFSPDGLTLVSVGRDRTVRVWDPLMAQEILTLTGHVSAVRTAAFSPDGTILATGSDDGAIRLWRAPGPPK